MFFVFKSIISTCFYSLKDLYIVVVSLQRAIYQCIDLSDLQLCAHIDQITVSTDILQPEVFI